MQPPVIALQILFVLRINCAQFPVQRIGKEQWFYEELSESIQGAVKGGVGLGRGSCNIYTR
jgi:hypothetical protein